MFCGLNAGIAGVGGTEGLVSGALATGAGTIGFGAAGGCTDAGIGGITRVSDGGVYVAPGYCGCEGCGAGMPGVPAGVYCGEFIYVWGATVPVLIALLSDASDDAADLGSMHILYEKKPEI
jgi:hypothetical protein